MNGHTAIVYPDSVKPRCHLSIGVIPNSHTSSPSESGKMIPIGETHDGRADMTNFEMDLFDTKMSYIRPEEKDDTCCSSRKNRNRIIKPTCVPITLISLLIIALVFLPLLNDVDLITSRKLSLKPEEPCGLDIAESIPTGLVFNGSVRHKKTHEEWLDLIDSAEKTIEIAAFYWNLNETYPTSKPGNDVFTALQNAGRRGVKVLIAQDISKGISENSDSAFLAREGLAQVRILDFTALMGGGVLHTKFIIVDSKNVYVGSANMDWKALTEVKEMGVVVRNCPAVAADIFRIFSVYWKLGEDRAKIPDAWPIAYRTQYNAKHPMDVVFNEARSKLYISSSPPPFNPKNRENDLDAIGGIISQAKYSVCVAVMDYIPATLYAANNSYWSDLDVAIRKAAYRGVKVRLLISKWDHSRSEMLNHLKSLEDINPAMPSGGSINVKWFTVPSNAEQKKIPFIRVNHNKYMVTDHIGYIGTSNWAGDYFTNTAGIGFVVQSNDKNSLKDQLQAVFDRDWNSAYASSLE